ncbi:anthranilate synthase component I [Bacillus taeanensis]|uniref:Anthranilate synthase component 1 n=1 Tax=Bacillus taeanensis TaxID=273032 RepID=A0A366XZR8_9BACI|nr:anthranilate synthase component I [Bacillus taeanensis]RBW70279.1 anthranilate synthase component I [Bacillus taeanensis]
MQTNYQQFLEDAKNYNTIPVIKRFFLDTMTPIQLFHNVKEDACFLLESKDDASPWSRYSFIGLNPLFTLKEEQGTFNVKSKENKVVLNEERFEDAVNKTISYLNPKPLDLPIPFTGGGVGYISYDGISHFERVPVHPANDLNISNFHFVFCELILAYDHTQKELVVLHHVYVEDNEKEELLKEKYETANRTIEELMNVLLKQSEHSGMLQISEDNDENLFEGVRSNFKKEDFMKAVEKVKEYIAAGDVFQTVISQRFEMDITVSALDIYRVLRVINPSPYLFYLKLEDFEVVGSSPEKLVQIYQGEAEIHPIAGTRRRGKTMKEDDELAEELLNDEKERAEHYMLVDLARNDIGRIAKYGTVHVPSLMDIGRFSHVMHIISKVRGMLAEGVSPVEALAASFPAGTVSGAPKVRSMEIIQEIEPTARNLYAGAIGYLGFDGNIDSCITIRSVLIKNQTAFVQAGAGVVADSIPENEWEETRNKAKALIKAISVAENIFSSKEANHA